MRITEIFSTNHPGVEVYASLTEAQLRNRLNPDNGIFIAESPKVIRVALDAGYEPLSLLCEEKHIKGDAADIIERIGDTPVFTGSREILSQLTGYTLTRGVLCAMRRRTERSADDICAGASRIAIIDGVTDTTNIGAIFRSAAALGIDGILLTPTSCDPLNRRSIRVSMGSVFLIKWAWVEPSFESIRQYGFKTVAMALTEDSLSIDSPILSAQPRLAIILGTEGDGLSDDVISKSDFVARIPMHNGVDSLNVAAASALAFWQLRTT